MTGGGSWASMAAGLVLPRGCAGCDAPDEVLCPSCRALFDRAVAVPMPECPMGAAYACAVYEGAVRRAVLGWKDHGDEECDRAFATALCTLAERVDVLRRLGASGKDGVLVVPAPSSARSTRRRGRRHLMPSARALAAWRGRSGVDARVRRVLANAADGGKAVETVGARGRAARLGGRIRVRGSAGLAGSRVILVDDIITTGATMRSCVAALDAAGAARVVCLALAATPRYGVSAM